MSYKKLFLTLASVAVIAAPIAVLADDAPATTDADSSTSAPSAPATVDTDSSAGTSAPSTVDSGSSAGSSAPADATGGGSAPIIVSGGSSSSSSGSSGSGYVLLSAQSASTTCPLISSFMKIGIANNAADVTKLQAFLKGQGFDADVTGTFDQKTEAAVEAFQKKYLSDILGPWGATKASGAVYITTLKKINQLACSQPLSLSGAELTVINSYRAKSSDAPAMSPAVNPAGATMGPVLATTTSAFDDVVGSSADADSNVAAAGKASIVNRFWGFIKNMF